MHKKNKTLQSFDCRVLVRLEGFEPPTFWFVAKHSIQLSYSRISLISCRQLSYISISISKMQALF